MASGPARPVTAAATPAPDRHLPEGDKVGPGERAIWTVRRGETLRQTLGRWADRSNRNVFWLLCEGAAGSRCVDCRSAVGGVYEGEFESALSWVLSGYGSATRDRSPHSPVLASFVSTLLVNSNV